ncbi:MAG: hypothetical protein EBR09_05755 [Proteobacteria bacterium]|nr:hypothetical protein [Pseudomonadota bacterium]
MKRESVNPSAVNGAILLLTVMSLFAVHFEAAGDQDAVARIAAISGPVFVRNTAGQVAAEKDLPLTLADQLTTGAAGVVQVKFNDGTSFTLYENSSIRIDKYRSAGKAAAGMTESAFEVLQGKLRFFVKPTKEKKNETQFRSKSAVMGIRGTSGLIGVNPSGETELVVFTGLVEVRNPKFPDVKIAVSPNFQTKIGLGSAPQSPRPVSADALKKLLPAVSGESGFTEDGIDQGAPERQNEKAPSKGEEQSSENKDKPKEQEKGSAKEGEEPSGQEKKSSDKDNGKSRRPSKPVFAPGGEVTNKNSQGPADSASKLSSAGQTSGGKADENKSGSKPVPASGLPQNQVQNPAVMSVDIDKVSSKVMNAIDRTQQSVREAAPPVTASPAARSPQRVKVKITLPSD